MTEEFKRHEWFDQYASDAVYLVELNQFEFYALWNKYKDIWKDRTCGGIGLVVGHTGEQFTMVFFSVFEIMGKAVVRFDATSQLVDHKQVEQYLVKTFPDLMSSEGKRRQKTDASNFHHIVHHIEELLEKEAQK